MNTQMMIDLAVSAARDVRDTGDVRDTFDELYNGVVRMVTQGEIPPKSRAAFECLARRVLAARAIDCTISEMAEAEDSTDEDIGAWQNELEFACDEIVLAAIRAERASL